MSSGPPAREEVGSEQRFLTPLPRGSVGSGGIRQIQRRIPGGLIMCAGARWGPPSDAPKSPVQPKVTPSHPQEPKGIPTGRYPQRVVTRNGPKQVVANNEL